MTDGTQTAQTGLAQPVQPELAQPAQPAPADAVVAAPAVGALEAIQTWTPPAETAAGQVPISARTGEPARVWTIWVAATACYLATAAVGVGTLWIYWDAVSRFAEASWLMGAIPSELGSPVRVLLAVAVTVIAIIIGTASAITGYFAYDGRRWTRWSVLVGLGLSALTLLLNRPAWLAIGFLAIAAVALWLPPSARYFAAWAALRHREPVFSEPPDHVWYGPLPRYR